MPVRRINAAQFQKAWLTVGNYLGQSGMIGAVGTGSTTGGGAASITGQTRQSRRGGARSRGPSKKALMQELQQLRAQVHGQSNT